MPLARLIYYSKAASTTTSSDVRAIEATSSKNNRAQDITGMLLLKDGWFVQCIEGERERISATYTRIASDKRHENVCLSYFNDVNQRYFDQWHVETFEGESAITIMHFFRFSVSRTFAPYELNSSNMDALMKTLARIVM